MYKEATKKKLRFATSKGFISVEDLWDLSLEALNLIAKNINRQIKEEGEEDFIDVKSPKSTLLEFQLEIIKDIIKDKKEEKEVKATLLVKKEKARQIQELINKKKNAALEETSLEELEKMLAELK